VEQSEAEQAGAEQAGAQQSEVEAAVAATPGEPAGQPGPGGHAPAPDVVRLKATGIELAVLGSPRGGGGADVVRFTDPARGVYQKLVVRDGRLAGAILLGDTRAAGTLTQLLDRGALLPADRWSLLAGRGGAGTLGVAESPVAIPGHATICQCNGVTKAAICAAWQQGARDAGQVAASTRASTGCGTCREAVEGIVAWLAAAEPDHTAAEPDHATGEPGPHPAEPDPLTGKRAPATEQAAVRTTRTPRTPQMSAR
jgi:assimilatory nitrate reductase electron transfer subunit